MKATLRHTQLYFDIAGMQVVPHGKGQIERPVLFLLHGGPGGDHFRFKQHSLALAEAAQLVFIDHRGCGRSKKTKASDYTLENNIEDIEALRQYLGLDRICLLGTSYGGMVAQGYATRYAKYLDKLILVATAPSYHFLESAKQTILARGNKKQIALTQHLWNGTFKNNAHILEFFKATDSLYSVANKKYRKSATNWSVDAINHGFKTEFQHFNFISQLKKITCPTLVLAGQDDWICQPAQSKIIASHIPNAKLKLFKHCGHAIAVDAHDQYIDQIQKFLGKKK